MNNFLKKLEKTIKINKSFLCVGLDSEVEKIPSFLKVNKNFQFIFNKAIIKVTCKLVCAYKINTAFYEGEGIEGWLALQETIAYLRKNYPYIPIILDAKRGDIENSNRGYIKMAFKWLKADALTLNPYFGKEALAPFLELKDKFFFILCHTSNKGAEEFQDLKTKNGQKVYEKIAANIFSQWNINKNCGLVVGATYPIQLKKIRKMVKDMWLLIPGVGSQKGEIKKVVKNGINSSKKGIIINCSRAVIFSGSDSNFAIEAYKKAKELKDQINYYL